ncbi:hypothetical protein BJY01DRAFT_138328 [Aspergillus pseudoustus]|uniref:Uncharacterized protein n=1 Tax=Aspergillus pseudoustus TaxID=1810923 RepID=A0ABR4KC67_9EURO
MRSHFYLLQLQYSPAILSGTKSISLRKEGIRRPLTSLNSRYDKFAGIGSDLQCADNLKLRSMSYYCLESEQGSLGAGDSYGRRHWDLQPCGAAIGLPKHQSSHTRVVADTDGEHFIHQWEGGERAAVSRHLTGWSNAIVGDAMMIRDRRPIVLQSTAVT